MFQSHQSKAFDTVWLDGLIYRLYNIGIKGRTWRLLRAWYNRLTGRVLLNGLLYESLAIKQGVRQDGVLSPWLFLCYNNDILSGQSILEHGLVTF